MSAWKKIAGTIGKAAPLLGGLLGGPAGSAVGSIVASTMGVEDSPDAVEAALNDPNLSSQHLAELKRLEIERRSELEALALEAETAKLAEVNKTMRVEAQSNDPYVRRWRPTWGYATAAAFTVQMIGAMGVIAWAVIANPSDAGTIISALFQGISALTAIWGIALAVLGVSVHERSKDKAVQAGAQPQPGLIGQLIGKIGQK